jgi:hypothetical protein
MSGVPSSEKRIRSQVKPSGVSHFSSTASAPASSGVTLGQRMSSLAISSGS